MNKILSLACALAVFALLSGCASFPLSNRARGAALWGAGGAGLGLMEGWSPKQTLGAAVVGAAIGYATTRPECVYRMHDNRYHVGTRVGPYEGPESRDCVATGPVGNQPSFDLPQQGRYPVSNPDYSLRYPQRGNRPPSGRGRYYSQPQGREGNYPPPQGGGQFPVYQIPDDQR